MPLLYSALGPVTLRIGGDEPVVPAGRDQVVLSMLLLNAGRAVALENLIDAVWGGEPPGSAHGQVHSCIFRLRRTLPDGVLRTSSPGYLLEVGDGEFDVTVFQQTAADGRTAVGQGRLAQGSRLMRQGLALWRGPAFASVDSSVIRAEASGLDELRQATWEECIETELQLGLGRELVGELTTLVRTYPLREEWRRLLMMALYRAGRQADALAVYQQARADLTDHLGVEPGPRLDGLHRRILRQDPSLLLGSEPATNGGTATGTETVALAASPPSGAPPSRRSPADGSNAAQLPVAVNGYVGRKAELAQLDSILATAGERAAGAVIAVIAGTAGVGKSAIAVHWGHRMRDKFPDGQLYVNLRGFDQNGPAMNPAEAVQGFLDALGMSGQQLPAGLAAQTAVYRSLLADRRVLVVLDNARDAEQVRPLLPGSAGCMALITSRNQMTTLLASEGAYLVPLHLISFAEARDLLAARLGEAKVASDPKAVETIITCCARLPLALAVAAARAAARPDFPLAVLAQDLLDVKNNLDALDSHGAGIDIRATFSWSYQTLGLHASRLFRLLPLVPGPHITPGAAASLGGLPATATTKALAELSRAHLVTEHSPGRFSFHDLLGAYAAELMQDVDSLEEQAAARQRMLDHYLHTACAAAILIDPYRNSISLARPHPQAQLTELGGREEAVAWVRAERPALLAAIQQAARTGFDVHTWQIAWAVADYCFYQGDWHGLAQTHGVALAAATRLADPVGMAHAHRGLAGAATSLGHHEDALAHLQQALSLFQQAESPIDEALIRRNLALTYLRQGRLPEAIGQANLALELCETVGDPAGIARTLVCVGLPRALLGQYDQALLDCERALELLEDLDDFRSKGDALHSIGYIYSQLSRHTQATSYYQRALELYEQVDDRGDTAHTLVALCEAYHAAGAVHAARHTLQDAQRAVDGLVGPDADRLRARLQGLG